MSSYMDKMDLRNNMLLLNKFFEDSDSTSILNRIAVRVRQSRLDLNLTQEALAKRAGITLSSYRRFERTGEIAFRSLVNIAIALDEVEPLLALFRRKQYQSLDELITTKDTHVKKRGRRK